MNQVHGNAVADMGQDSLLPEADAMVSRGSPAGRDGGGLHPRRAGWRVAGRARPGCRACRASGHCQRGYSGYRGQDASPRGREHPRVAGSFHLRKLLRGARRLRAEVAAAVPAARTTTSWGTPGLDLPCRRPQPAGTRQASQWSTGALHPGKRHPSFHTGGTAGHGRFAGLVWTP
jgi:hypothetical protein